MVDILNILFSVCSVQYYADPLSVYNNVASFIAGIWRNKATDLVSVMLFDVGCAAEDESRAHFDLCTEGSYKVRQN